MSPDKHLAHIVRHAKRESNLNSKKTKTKLDIKSGVLLLIVFCLGVWFFFSVIGMMIEVAT